MRGEDSFEILKIDSKNAGAEWIVKEIGKLYTIESKAKEANLNSQEHLRLRQSESRPIVDEIRSWMNKRIVEVAPKSFDGESSLVSCRAVGKASCFFGSS
ncbi:IS66 family element, transposase domain protein [Leptospira interrogans serovar Autumnalis str. LP101]|nr:IS66 family element, transposase domain protein [Leptospira interrogans serovar Autumnalis str. LP101]